MADTTAQRLLAYAIQRLGTNEVAKRLTAPEESIDAWMAGESMPPKKALALADLIDKIDSEKAK